MSPMSRGRFGRVAHCSVVLVLITLAASAMGQAHGTWSPLYAQPPYDRLEWTLTVRELSDPHAFYCWAFQDGFLNGGIFYFGLQPWGRCPEKHGTCKVALFSFFGNGATSSSPHCNPGADNGPGMSCHIPYQWRRNVAYRFVIELTGSDAERKRKPGPEP